MLQQRRVLLKILHQPKVMLLLPPGGLCTFTDVVTAGLTPAATAYCYGTVSSSFFSSSSTVAGTDETTGATG